MKEYSVAFLIPYFGKWPEWMELYIHSVELNHTIDFHFITDCDTEISSAPNIHFHPCTFEEYVSRAQELLKVEINIPNPYKICDLRPFFGIIHQDIIEQYDFFGWTDVDVVFGDIRSFYTPELFEQYDVLSSQEVRLSGHCSLLRNTETYRNIGYKIYDWKGALSNPDFVGIDEHGITNALCMTFWDKLSEKLKAPWIANLFNWRKKMKMRPYYFVEQFSTPFTPLPWLDGTINSDQPDEWYYHQGKVSNKRDVGRKFMYFHFMNFKSGLWRHDGSKAPWEGLKRIYNIHNLEKEIIIDKTGFRNRD
jgi:hypothetical protein